MNQDNLYALPLSCVGEFVFDEQVVRVFPDMITRSVPGYASMLAMTEQLTKRYARPGSTIWDLGCSLGAVTRLIRPHAPRDCVIHALDSSEAMIGRLQEILRTESTDELCPVQLHCSDLRTAAIEDASLVILNLTLQFIPPAERSQVLCRIASGMRPGGALLLSEKLCFENDDCQQLMTDLHHDFKRANGYSDLEIAQKRSAIENFLIPETMNSHLQRLHEVGFRTAVPWFQCFTFASILAIR